jgi:hypothetical protein
MVLSSREGDDDGLVGGGILEAVGVAFQPVVWISLCSLAGTGHGLPAGPGGLIGAVEGIAYLVVVLLALLPKSAKANDDGIGGNKDNDDVARDHASGDAGGSSLTIDVTTLSRITIAMGLLVLASVITGKGCVPNAKPLLDYSAYLPICDPQ